MFWFDSTHTVFWYCPVIFHGFLGDYLLFISEIYWYDVIDYQWSEFLQSLDEWDWKTRKMKWMECFVMKNIKFHLAYTFLLEQSPDKMCMELFRFYLIYAIKCHFTWPLLTWHGQYVSCISSKYGYWWSWWLMKFANASLIYHIATCVTKYFAVVK